MSAGDPHHDHSTCGGTTSVTQAQKQTDLMAEILTVAMTKHTKLLRLGFTNARSGPVNFSRPLAVIRERCDSVRHLDLTFATDTLLPTKPGVEVDTFNAVYVRELHGLARQLAAHNNITTLKVLLCNKQILQEISKCSKLTVLEIIEASVRHECSIKHQIISFIFSSCCGTRTWRCSPRARCGTTSPCSRSSSGATWSTSTSCARPSPPGG